MNEVYVFYLTLKTIYKTKYYNIFLCLEFTMNQSATSANSDVLLSKGIAVSFSIKFINFFFFFFNFAWVFRIWYRRGNLVWMTENASTLFCNFQFFECIEYDRELSDAIYFPLIATP